MAKRSKFQQESEAQSDAPAAPSQEMVALFNEAPETAKLQRRNLPMMIKPDQVPIGGAVSGEIVKIVDSPSTTVKGKLLWLRHQSGQEFTFPCTGVIRNALAPGVKSDDKELTSVLEKEVGKILIAKRLPNKPSKFKKEMFMFDVYTANK